MPERAKRITAFSPAYHSPSRHYSSLHIMVIEAIVLAFLPSGC
jgi:hypothetical protein